MKTCIDGDGMKITTMSSSEQKYAFFCPGCNFAHWFRTGGGGWTWNGDRNKPTVNPSILAWGKRTPTDDEADRIMKGEKVDIPDFRCHSFVRDGNIQFLGDCTHALKGQTVELPEFPGCENA